MHHRRENGSLKLDPTNINHIVSPPSAIPFSPITAMNSFNNQVKNGSYIENNIQVGVGGALDSEHLCSLTMYT